MCENSTIREPPQNMIIYVCKYLYNYNYVLSYYYVSTYIHMNILCYVRIQQLYNLTE